MPRTLVAAKLHYNFNVTGGISTYCNLGMNPLSIEAKLDNVGHITHEFKVRIMALILFPNVTESLI